jgi:predicted MFS family arabinose efflux permease
MPVFSKVPATLIPSNSRAPEPETMTKTAARAVMSWDTVAIPIITAIVGLATYAAWEFISQTLGEKYVIPHSNILIYGFV